MAASTDAAQSPAAPHEPPCTYTANNGYDNNGNDEIPAGLRQAHDAQLTEHERIQNYYLYGEGGSDLEDYDEPDDAILDGASGNLTKTYNRQKHQQDTNGGAGGSNPQKPTANTFASVDDQVAELSKHASKIRLDNVKDGEERVKDKADRATTDQVLDAPTKMTLLQMINGGFVSEIHGAVSTGKEANVYGAILVDHDADPDAAPAVTHRAVKVYKTAILVFRDRERYIAGEHRFKGGFDKGNTRKMIKLWALKEFRNLRRLHAAGVPCPEPVALKQNVLVMGFLGDRRGWAYPRLHDAALSGDDVDEQWHRLYVQLLGLVRRMWRVCRLVHADLSEYNLLYHDGRIFVIDVSQSVEPDHPRALEFLRMDIKNVGDFFRRRGVRVLPDRAVFNFVTAVEGPTGEDAEAAAAAVEKLYDAVDEAADEDAAARDEVDNEVFRNQYIPQTLEQVYDIEKDAAAVHRGQGKDLVYSNLLADQVVEGEAGEAGSSAASDDDDEGASLGSGADEGDDESRFEKGTPRGHRFEDKDEKRLRKQAVKEARREKRSEKMPKYQKKALVASSSRRKK
ncbi:serine/threonine-protein kinase RIO1 [Cordyceps fumosorosea ARSEF 2679]|uniref:Serine/threonine-protein kinase RIO1 n=1 Tax=Cordyceps fumosorosea (strain ARSEF 2679) TaxID=1081104 RepID=A0A168D8Q9_CORFA|nr:serine/threonine-protein kinase RIO1 [Cordyceps fumosorosea ARSEF 2679]OAA72298.1 serine/threonine-protein kinase RIO1 [Cordyceps fumosorosea ARSEF 2679]